jgi:zinc/manganese transport system permease protein
MVIFTMLAIPFITCLLLSITLGYLGLHVLKREVIFIDITVAQVAALGAIAAHIIFHVHGDSPEAMACAIGATMITALFFSLTKKYVSQLPIEATIGITYAIVAAGTLFLIGKSTSGHSHVQEMMTGSLLWVKWQELSWTALAFTITGIIFFICRQPIQEISNNYNKTITRKNTVIWDFIFYTICGIIITFSVRLAGVVIVFCLLIIPATISALFTSKWQKQLAIAYTVSITASVAGLLFSRWLDFSAGVSVALFLCIFLLLALFVDKLSPCNSEYVD